MGSDGLGVGTVGARINPRIALPTTAVVAVVSSRCCSCRRVSRTTKTHVD
jgi:hypothetical protein